MKMRTSTLVATALTGALALGLCTACTMHRRAPETAKPGSGIAEYRGLVSTARKSVENVLQSLASVNTQSNRVSPAALQQLSLSIRDLQAESVPARARAKVILDRGDDYFKNWHEHLARIEDPQVRAQVEKNRPQLQQNFGAIKAHSLDTQEAFRPFMDSLRQLRNLLEKDPASLPSQPDQDLVRSSSESGQRVLLALANVQRDLDYMTALITPPAQR